jgi:hypothetical protein
MTKTLVDQITWGRLLSMYQVVSALLSRSRAVSVNRTKGGHSKKGASPFFRDEAPNNLSLNGER